MDIDDILREADPGLVEVAVGNSDLQALTRAWVAERSAPEILEWPANDLIDRVNGRIRAQVEKVEEMTGDMDPKTNFQLIVIQTELERWKFLVRSFLRARIAKLDKHTLYYLSNPDLKARLSPTEISYATHHQSILHSHYLTSFLSTFPQNLQGLDDNSGGLNMVDGPDLDTAVFIRILKAGVVVTAKGRDEDDSREARAGEIVVLRWSDGRGLVESGDGELV